MHAITGKHVVANAEYDPQRLQSAVLHSMSGLQTLRPDLLTLIAVPRIKLLSWQMPWWDLQEHCLGLLDDEQKRQRVEHELTALWR